MKLDQIEQIEEKELERRIRYRVTLTTRAFQKGQGRHPVGGDESVGGARSDAPQDGLKRPKPSFLSRPSQIGTLPAIRQPILHPT
jgi:hypothetical protein